MRFSVWLSSGWPWDSILSVAQTAEAQGWDGVWVPDHFMAPERGYGNEPDPTSDPELTPVHEGWTLLSALAATVPRVTLGVLVSGVSYRHPAVLAKMAATVDHISGGRLIVGLGAGWQENEYRHYGIDYPGPAMRSDLLEEAAAVITALTGQALRTTFDGAHYRLDGAPLEPKPLQQPLPLLIGGGGEQRTLLTAARYATHWNTWGTPAELQHKIGILRRRCEEVGRDPSTVGVSANSLHEVVADPAEARQRAARLARRGGLVGTPQMIRDNVAAYAAAGVGELVVAGFNHAPANFPAVLGELRAILAL